MELALTDLEWSGRVVPLTRLRQQAAGFELSRVVRAVPRSPQPTHTVGMGVLAGWVELW